jgi:hypothetical protein
MELPAWFIPVVLYFLFSPGRLVAEKVPDGTGFIINSTITITGIKSGSAGPLGELESVIIPLKRVGRLFMIEARIDNIVGNFLFDTGSAELVLNSTYFRKI